MLLYYYPSIKMSGGNNIYCQQSRKWSTGYCPSCPKCVPCCRVYVPQALTCPLRPTLLADFVSPSPVCVPLVDVDLGILCPLLPFVSLPQLAPREPCVPLRLVSPRSSGTVLTF